MPWIATARLRDDQVADDIGSISLVWDQGGADEFTFSKVGQFIAANLPALKTEAVAARTAAATRRAREVVVKSAVETEMNS